MEQTVVLIVGASVAGLACAAALHKKGVAYRIIEKESQVATPWRNHYYRLHLHTYKNESSLPFKKFGRTVPRYPSRKDVMEYLEAYQKEFQILPAFHTEAKRIRLENEHWITETSGGLFQSDYVILATGNYSQPRTIDIPGMETFPGRILHSMEYRTGGDFSGQRVLVVGFGNSASEIALDLCEHRAMTALSVRSPINIIPRDLFGIPIQRISLMLSRLSPRLADALVAPILRLWAGRLDRLGLRKLEYGPFEQIQKNKKIPSLDLGTLRLIRQGRIRAYGRIESIAGRIVCFENGKKDDFDAIIAAIGYDRNMPPILGVDPGILPEPGVRMSDHPQFGAAGLYFCGFWIGATGVIREISREALRIAADIEEKQKK